MLINNNSSKRDKSNKYIDKNSKKLKRFLEVISTNPKILEKINSESPEVLHKRDPIRDFMPDCWFRRIYFCLSEYKYIKIEFALYPEYNPLIRILKYGNYDTRWECDTSEDFAAVVDRALEIWKVKNYTKARAEMKEKIHNMFLEDKAKRKNLAELLEIPLKRIECTWEEFYNVAANLTEDTEINIVGDFYGSGFYESERFSEFKEKKHWHPRIYYGIMYYLIKSLENCRYKVALDLADYEELVDYDLDDYSIVYNDTRNISINECASLLAIRLPKYSPLVISIRGCRNLRKIFLPYNKGCEICRYSFDGCNSLEEVVFYGKSPYIVKDGFLIKNRELLRVYKTDFDDTIRIPDGVVAIKEYSIDDVKTSKIIIPKSVKDIYNGAFSTCILANSMRNVKVEIVREE